MLLLPVAAVHVPFLQSVSDTAALSGAQWLLAVAVASSVLWAEEARELVMRRLVH